MQSQDHNINVCAPNFIALHLRWDDTARKVRGSARLLASILYYRFHVNTSHSSTAEVSIMASYSLTF